MSEENETIEARAVDRGNLRALLDIKVRDDQRHLVASNAVTIAQVSYEPYSWLRGLWMGDQAVGLVAMIDLRPDHPDVGPNDPKNAAYLWRLMIEATQQHKGYGRQAIVLAFQQARIWERDTLCLHVSEREGNALAFYRRFGLEPTGRVDTGEAVLTAPVPAP